MRRGQQFKIDSIEELREAYEKLSPWGYELEREIKDFKSGSEYVVFKEGKYFLVHKWHDHTTIPNPFKKEKPEPFLKALNDFHKATESMKTLIKVAEWAKERNELRKELKALRKEVEELKNPIKEYYLISADKVPDFIEGDNEICDWLNCKGENPIPKEPLFEWIKKQKEEKPKESPEQKGFIRLSRDFDSIQVQPEDGFARLSMNSDSIMLDRDHVKRLVNYLKKHFEI